MKLVQLVLSFSLSLFFLRWLAPLHPAAACLPALRANGVGTCPGRQRTVERASTQRRSAVNAPRWQQCG